MEYLINLLFNWKGRINRKTYIGAYILLGLLAICINYFSIKDSMSAALLNLSWLPLLFSNLVIAKKRLQDTNKSIWWGLSLMFGPIVSIPILITFGLGSFGLMMLVISVVFIGFLSSHLVFKRGTEGVNKYGADPSKQSVIADGYIQRKAS